MGAQMELCDKGEAQTCVALGLGQVQVQLKTAAKASKNGGNGPWTQVYSSNVLSYSTE